MRNTTQETQTNNTFQLLPFAFPPSILPRLLDCFLFRHVASWDISLRALHKCGFVSSFFNPCTYFDTGLPLCSTVVFQRRTTSLPIIRRHLQATLAVTCIIQYVDCDKKILDRRTVWIWLQLFTSQVSTRLSHLTFTQPRALFHIAHSRCSTLHAQKVFIWNCNYSKRLK